MVGLKAQRITIVRAPCQTCSFDHEILSNALWLFFLHPCVRGCFSQILPPPFESYSVSHLPEHPLLRGIIASFAVNCREGCTFDSVNSHLSKYASIGRYLYAWISDTVPGLDLQTWLVMQNLDPFAFVFVDCSQKNSIYRVLNALCFEALTLRKYGAAI